MAVRGPYESDSSSDTPRTLGGRMKMLRIQRGLTQAELGEALNTDQTMISLWERGKVKPSGAALAGIAAFFGMHVRALETGEGLGVPVAQEPIATAPQAPGKRDSVTLPDVGPGAVLAMDLRTGAEQRLESMEAMGFLVKALKEGRTVWIVTG
jgi:putative transcriptional regulator